MRDAIFPLESTMDETTLLQSLLKGLPDGDVVRVTEAINGSDHSGDPVHLRRRGKSRAGAARGGTRRAGKPAGAD
ncbi:MAG: hypothetical protein JWM48_1456 [Mycobacterium sp.]|jgi:hypothetical protein|nr:hypothetical protein [Mycobacterium sp.]